MNTKQNYAVIGGITIGLGLLGVRLGMAESILDPKVLLFALGTTAFEIGTVVFLKYKASELEPKLVLWRTARDTRAKAKEIARAALDQLSDREALLGKAEEKSQAILEKRGINSSLANEDKLRQDAVNAAMAGYAEGLRKRYAIMHGIPHLLHPNGGQ